ncbi:hypothetical protein Nepgr_022313 [Nepenthes gracilis]|uniref:Glycolipid transfer protein domain-containing protein n=1 Tax=Nepenthes gracilis TaxID=150966 RepID=A0AAD3XWP1_NEPGR|nr:hypothetical protein Nepgr_022313 [Nepenthes gracilis]
MQKFAIDPLLRRFNEVKSQEGRIRTKPFLDVCKHLLPLIDNFGSSMSCIKSDVACNIRKLESKYFSNTSAYSDLYSMTHEEIKAKIARNASSCTTALVWLTRAMDFVVQLFRNLLEHPDWSMPKACTDSYKTTLKKWHGWLGISTFNVIMKIAPDKEKFMGSVIGQGNLTSEIEKFCLAFTPLLEENHKFLVSVGVDDIRAL